MDGRRSIACALGCVLLVSCSVSEDGEGPGAATSSTSGAASDFEAEVDVLCAPVAEEHDRLLDARGVEEFHAAAEDVARAELDLAEDLSALEPPAEVSDVFDAYVAALEGYANAQVKAATGAGGSKKKGLRKVVQAAKTGVTLDELAAEAELPESCPPPPSVDVHNTLFVAKANRECFDVGEDVRAAGRLKKPQTSEEALLVLELARQVTAGVTGAVETAAGPATDRKLVERIVRVNEKRVDAIHAIGTTFEEGDYRSYRKAARKLIQVTRKANETLLSVGLVSCVKVFSLVPL